MLDKYLNKKRTNKNKIISRYISKILICTIIILISLIFTKISDQNYLLFKENVLTKSFDFMSFKKEYEKIANIKNKDEEMVFSDVNLTNGKEYYDGQSFSVGKDYPVKNIKEGIVVFKGEKENFKSTVIVQTSDGFDIWYSNLDNINVNVYDYLKSDEIIGNANDLLYLKIVKNNKTYTYEEYQNKV